MCDRIEECVVNYGFKLLLYDYVCGSNGVLIRFNLRLKKLIDFFMNCVVVCDNFKYKFSLGFNMKKG